MTSKAGLVHPFPDVLLDLVNRVLETLRDGVTPEGFDVETVCGSRENEERDNLDQNF